MTKTAVITGTSSGLGEELAKSLLKLGWKVYGLSRRGNSTLSKSKRYIDIKVDLSNMKQLKEIVSQIKENRIDLLINNAGIVQMKKASEWTEETFQQTFAINYIAPVQLLNELLEKIKGNQVINIISESSHIAWNEFGIYGASKAALWHHMKAFAEGNPDINIINIHPDAFDSPMIDNAGQEMIEERHEFMTVSDISKFVVQIAEKKVNLQSGASVFMFNEWEAEQMELLHDNEYMYNTDTKLLTYIEK